MAPAASSTSPLSVYYPPVTIISSLVSGNVRTLLLSTPLVSREGKEARGQ